MTDDDISDSVETTITTTELDVDETGQRLAAWLATRLGEDAALQITNLRRPEGSGMSSISVLFDLAWTEGGERQERAMVARLAPEAAALPVFPGYDLQAQFDAMRAVREHTEAPVPLVRWIETSPEALGTPFLVMDQVAGAVPVDNPPYVFGGWLSEMSDEEQAAVQETSVRMLAAVHTITDPVAVLPGLAPSASGGSLREHFARERAYYEWTRRDDELRIPCLERSFAWLEENWPEQPSPDVLCWGDARIGNIMFDGTEAVAVLDWESAAIAPREVDLGWFIFFHAQFQMIADFFEMPGLPHLFRRDDVVAAYERLTGTTVRDLDWHLLYAALRHGIVMSQITRRRIHFGEIEAPADLDEYVMHHPMINALLAGTYSWES